MPYLWTDEMPAANHNPAYEPYYRAAVIAAATHLEKALEVPGATVPAFNGGHFVSAANPQGKAMEADILAAIAAVGPRPELTAERTIVAFAVRAAHVVREGGFGDQGWAHFAERLWAPAPRPVRRPVG